MAFGNGLEQQEEVMSEINMTPMVDVMLVLLIIFILAMPMITHSIEIDLPQASNQASDSQPESITLTVAQQGEVHWNNEIISADQLQQRLQYAAQQQPQPAIQLRGDRQVDYEHVIKVMAAVQQAGINSLGFITAPAGQ